MNTARSQYQRHGREADAAPPLPLVLLLGALVLGSLGLGGAAAAQAPAPAAVDSAARALSIEEALRIAESQSEAVQVARAGVDRARGQQLQARSQYMPQLNASAQYTRTLESRFEAFAQAPAPADPRIPTPEAAPTPGSCLGYLPPQGTTPTADQLAQAALCRTQFAGGGIDFTQAGFGARNQYQIGLAGSINLFTGGRVAAQNRVAAAGSRSAEVELRAQRAQLALDVTQAYYDAVLAGRLLAIAESTLVQTEGVLRQVRLARQVGNQSEFELLRAQVTRDNVLPQRIQARTQHDLAMLRLKQLLNLPLSEPVRLTSDLRDGEAAAASGVRLAADGQLEVVPNAASTVGDTTAEERATVRQAAEAVRVQENLLRAVRAQRLPAIQLSTQYGRVAFPVGGVPELNSFLSDWTVSVGATLPLFTGGRIRGEELVARADLAEARARFQQTREFASLDAQLALAQLQEAEATWAASAGTAEQASRAYTIAEVRYREGLSTQVELSESRLLLQQSQANRAQAARDLQVARVRLALLRDLPLQASGGGGAAAQQQQQQSAALRRQQQQQQQQQQRQQQQQQSAAGAAGQAGQ